MNTAHSNQITSAANIDEPSTTGIRLLMVPVYTVVGPIVSPELIEQVSEYYNVGSEKTEHLAALGATAAVLLLDEDLSKVEKRAIIDYLWLNRNNKPENRTELPLTLAIYKDRSADWVAEYAKFLAEARALKKANTCESQRPPCIKLAGRQPNAD